MNYRRLAGCRITSKEDKMARRWQAAAVLLVLTLVLILMLACAPKPAPSPTPSPSPSPTPSPSPSPKPEVTISFLAGSLGGLGNALTYGLTDLINKNSDWLRATTVETGGSIENARTLSEEPEKRKTFAYYSTNWSEYQAKIGDPPFTKPYTTGTYIAKFADVLSVMCTRDPSIKTAMDFVGKRVAIGGPGKADSVLMEMVMKYGWGIWDKVNVELLDFEPAKDALIDGVIDVALAGSSVAVPGETADKPKKVVGNPTSNELIDRVKPYVADQDKAALDKAREATGYPIFWVEVPAGTFGPNQTEPVGSHGFTLLWVADQEMDEEVAYEITRIIYEHADQFGEYHAGGKAVTRDSLAAILGTTEADFHPGAVKFYKEHGVKIGG